MPAPVPAIRLRPLTLADVLDESFRLYRAHFPLLGGIAVAIAVPGVLINIASGGSTSAASIYAAAITNTAPTAAPGTTNLALALLAYPVQLALIPFQAGALFCVASALVLGGPAEYGTTARGVIRRYWALFALSLLYGVTSFALVCPPLGIWLLTRLAFAVPALLTEQAPVMRAVERSWRLTERSFWRTLGVVVCAAIMGYALQTALAAVFVTAAGLIPGLPLEARLLVIVSVASLMTQLVEPLLALSVTLLYFDARVRREAFDLEMSAYQLASALEPGA